MPPPLLHTTSILFQLTIETPTGKVTRLLERAEYALGRDSALCEIVIESSRVEPVHARLKYENGSWRIEPLGPVKIEGELIDAARTLEADCTFWLGLVPVKFERVEPDRQPTVEETRAKLQRIEFTHGGLRIGSAPDCGARLPGLAPLHARAAPHGNDWLLIAENQGEAQFGDVLVNRAPALKALLKRGDRVQLGPYTFIYKNGGLDPDRGLSGMELECNDLAFSVPGGRTLIRKFSFTIRPNEFVGIIGPSGSGKSTLLKLLAGYLRPDAEAGGEIRFDGAPAEENPAALRAQIGYVPQDDILHLRLPVETALDYAAQLRMQLAKTERRERVDEALAQVQLGSRRDVPVARLSGGQRKRVNVAAELLSHPRLLLMDEPTSGLDPGTEADLMRQLREMAGRRQTIVCTTHVMENAELFDKILVIKPEYEGGPGRLDFFGPPSELRRHYNIERLVDVYRRVDPSLAPRPVAVPKAEQPVEQYFQWPRWLPKILNPFFALELGGAALADLRNWFGNFAATGGAALRQTRILTRRYLNLLGRDRQFIFLLLLVQPLLLGLMIALAVPADRKESSLELTLFLGAVSCIWLGLNSSIREIVRERLIFRRERQAGLLLPPYLASKALALALVGLLQCALLTAILASRPLKDREDFRIEVLRDADFEAPNAAAHFDRGAALGFAWPSPAEFAPQKMLRWWPVYWLCFLAALALGLLVSALARSNEAAVGWLPILIIPQILFSRVIIGYGKSTQFGDSWLDLLSVETLIGTFQRGDVLSICAVWLSRLMPSHYGLELALALERGDPALFYAGGLLLFFAGGLACALLALRGQELPS